MKPFQLGALFRSPFGRALALTLLAFTVVPILALGALSAYTIQVQLKERSIAQMTTVANLIQGSLAKWTAAANDQLAATLTNAAIAQNSAFLLQSGTDSARVEQVVIQNLSALTQSHRFSTIYLVRPDGQIALSTNPDFKAKSLGISIDSLEQEHKRFWGFQLLPLTNRTAALTWQPILNTRQEMLGFLVGELDLQSLSGVIKDSSIGIGSTGEAYLVDARELPLTAMQAANATPNSDGAALKLDPAIVTAIYDSPSGYAGVFQKYDGSPVVGAVQPLAVPLRAWLIVEQGQSEAFDMLYTVARTALLFTALLTVLAVIASVLTTQRIVNPLQQLAQAATSMSRGKFAARVALNRRDEFGALANSFNAMAGELENAFASLEGSNRKLTTRADQLAAITRVGEHATSFLNLDDLLPTLAQEIQHAFNYYAVTLYLPEPGVNTLLGKAAAGASAQQFVETQTRREIGGESLVGAAAGQRQIMNAPDVLHDSRYAAHPLRPATRSEVSIPLMVSTKLIGVLDIQSERANGFSPEDLEILQILARQTAIAIRNADLFRESEAARQLADDANRQKSEFLSNMSHELRTPLNVIIGYSHSILNRPAMYEHVALPSVYEAGMRNIMNSGQHLLGLINDILDLSKIEAGQIDLTIEPVDPLPILNGIRATGLGLVKPDVQIRADYPEKLPEILGDELRIRQILLNLVSNAAKFTEQGFITLNAQAQGDKLLFSVADTGSGIPDEARPYLFDRFRQAGREVTRKHGGSGLGLSICRQLSTMHGGDIWFESQLGKGTTFFFTIPLVVDVKEKTRPKPPEGMAAVLSTRAEIFEPAEELAQQAFLIDTRSESRTQLESVLSGVGYDVLVTDDAERGLEMAEVVLPSLLVIHLHKDDPPAMHGLPDRCRAHGALSALPLVVLHDVQDVTDPAILAQFINPQPTLKTA